MSVPLSNQGMTELQLWPRSAGALQSESECTIKVQHACYHMLLSCLQVHQEMLQNNKLLVG